MKLTPSLVNRLYRGFTRDPQPILALRIAYDGALAWTVADRVLTLTASGGSGESHVISLAAITIQQLVNQVASLPGYTTPFMSPEFSQLSAAILLDGSGDQSQSNGDHLYGYSAMTWAYMDAMAVELTEAAHQIDNMLLQMSPLTAEAEWLDVWGGYFGVPRLEGEGDRPYGTRMIAEVLLPRGNNVALEVAIAEAIGQPVTVTDVVGGSGLGKKYDSTYQHDGSITHSGIGSGIIQYGLFDVAYGYDLLSGQSLDGYADMIRGLIDRMRFAGTQLRALSLSSSVISDPGPGPLDDEMTLIISP